MHAPLRCIACLLLLCTCGFAQQSPDLGKVAGNMYTNDFFHFIYTIPDGWSVRTDELTGKVGNLESKLLLYVTKAPDSYAAVAITYEDVSATSFWRADEYLDALQAGAKARPVGRRTSHTFGGRQFERQDFEVTPATHYLAYVAGIVRGYALVFTLHANSQAELDNLEGTIAAAKFAPDWSSGVPAGQGCPNLRTDASGKPIVERIRVSGEVQEGLLLTKENPRYPADARQKHIQGSVIMTALIGCDGLMRALSVVSGPPVLIDATLDPVSRWKYRPYILNGKPIEVETTITVNFELR